MSVVVIQPLPPFAGQFFAGAQRLELAAANLFGVVAALDARAPGFADEAALRAAFAVDGTICTDWSAPLRPGAEVTIFPRVAGGGEQGDLLEHRLLVPFGVEIAHDLARPLSPGQEQQFRDLFAAHALILARGQNLSMARQRALCGLLGPVLLRQGEDGIMSNEAGGPAASALAWHADAAYTRHPFEALSLHGLDVAGGATSTRFVHAGDALDTLDPDLRARIEGREQEMIAPHYTRIAERTCERRDPEALSGGVMPAVRNHPGSGRALLWVGEMQTARLLGMDWEKSRALLRALFDHLYAAERVFEHRWHQGDFIVWDNIALQHARGNLEGTGRRVLQRVIVGREGVAPHVAARSKARLAKSFLAR